MVERLCKGQGHQGLSRGVPEVEKSAAHGKIVAIDIKTGAFELADDTITATDRLYERVPNAQPWVIRIGHRTVYRFGSRSLKKSV